MIGWLVVGLLALQPAEQRGARLFRECQDCHALEPGVNTPAGPTLHGIVDRPIAAERRFNYSPAMRRLAEGGRVWTRERLDRFLRDSETAVRGTEMGYTGMADPADRRALIDWLGARGRRTGRP